MAKEVKKDESRVEKAKLRADHKAAFAALRADWICKCQAQNHWESRTCYKCNTIGNPARATSATRSEPRHRKRKRPSQWSTRHACTSGGASIMAAFTTIERKRQDKSQVQGTYMYTAWKCTKC